MNTPTMEPPQMESPPAPQRRAVTPEASYAAPPETAWRPLYLIAGGAAMLSVALIAAAVGVFLFWPPPSDVTGWFTLLRQNPLLGLLNLDLVMVVSAALLIPLYLALYTALRRISQSLALIALALGLVGSALMIAANPAFSMLSLSDGYAAATTEAQRAVYLAAGQAALTNWTGTAFNVAYLFAGLTALIFSLLMLRSDLFSKVTAFAGIALGVLALVPATVGTVGLWVSLASLIPTVIWLALTSQQLTQLAVSLGLGGEGFVIARPRRPRRA